jgi:TatA/E family protein of Tat protein translocase
MNTLASFSPPDMIWIFLIALLLFGAKKLPELAKGMGSAVREFNKAKDEIEREITKPLNEVTAQPAPNRQEYAPVAPAISPVAPAAPVAAVPPPAVPAPETPVTPPNPPAA